MCYIYIHKIYSFLNVHLAKSTNDKQECILPIPRDIK